MLVIGGGGREHALAWKLSQSPKVEKVFVAPGNAGTGAVAQNVPIHFTDVPGLLAFAVQNRVDLTVVGQEAASEAGVADEFHKAGLAIFGPSRAASRIESSKAFAKALMAENAVPTAGFRSFTDARSARVDLAKRLFPVVVKASGLAEGKGVVIAGTLEEALQAIDDIMVAKRFGAAGDTVIVEDFLSGQEISVHALCDEQTALLFPASQDHKQVYDDDKGPNTGGMGVVAPVPWVTSGHLATIETSVVLPTLDGLRRQQAGFVGCLYPGLMIEGESVKVVEFNARFGDPEAQSYMRLLDGDLFEILAASTKGELSATQVAWHPGTAISVALVSSGYPASYKTGFPISGIARASLEPDVVVFHGGTVADGKVVTTAGGRALYVTAVGSDIDDARQKAYTAIELISFDGMSFRSDIGLRPSPEGLPEITPSKAGERLCS
ncbi:MAG: phosphoribosylamine--glycine ligase [Acidimicrobiales bacterium]